MTEFAIRWQAGGRTDKTATEIYKCQVGAQNSRKTLMVSDDNSGIHFPHIRCFRLQNIGEKSTTEASPMLYRH